MEMLVDLSWAGYGSWIGCSLWFAVVPIILFFALFCVEELLRAANHLIALLQLLVEGD